MVIGIFHFGSGLGNMLHRYIATRILALDKGYDFAMVNPDGFKGKSFMNLDMGKQLEGVIQTEHPSGKVIPYLAKRVDGKLVDADYKTWEEWDKFTYDPDFNFVEDNTIIDGSFEDERYFGHRMDEIHQWLKTEELEVPYDTCVIGFRGGEYYTVPELGLPREYYDRAIVEMQKLGINKFEVHTDDPELAKQFFPNYPIIKDISLNWRSMRYALYAIIANSSFYVLPRLLAQEHIKAITIAPRYFNRYNTKKWDYPQSYYKSFKYIHHEKM